MINLHWISKQNGRIWSDQKKMYLHNNSDYVHGQVFQQITTLDKKTTGKYININFKKHLFFKLFFHDFFQNTPRIQISCQRQEFADCEEQFCRSISCFCFLLYFWVLFHFFYLLANMILFLKKIKLHLTLSVPDVRYQMLPVSHMDARRKKFDT